MGKRAGPATPAFSVFLAVLIVAWPASEAAAAAPRKRAKDAQTTTPQSPPDRRDRTVALPGSPFNGRPYWLALAQCGGVYFRLATLTSDAAARARAIKPDPAAVAQFSRRSDAASGAVTAFFEAAERILVADRAVARDQAVLLYDPRAAEAGDKLGSIEAAENAAKPCPALYRACGAAHGKLCLDPRAPTS